MANPIISSRKVQGTKVVNPAGEDLGRIEDIMIDKVSGRAVYAVLSFGGFLGMAEKHFALPWSALTFAPEREAYIVKIDKDILQRAPGFERDAAPDLSDPDWGRRIQDYYGAEEGKATPGRH